MHGLSLGKNTNAPTTVPSLNIYEAIYFIMFYVVKICKVNEVVLLKKGILVELHQKDSKLT